MKGDNNKRLRAAIGRRAPCERYLTSQEIYEGLVAHGGAAAWGAEAQQDPTTLRGMIETWRRSMRPATVAQLAEDLRRAGVNGTAINSLVDGRCARLAPWAPPVTRAEIAQDAQHIAQWGYV